MAIRASLPKGTRDFLPSTLLRREHVIETIRTTYQRYGYEPLETPAIENLETLSGKYGEEGDRLIFKILKRGAKAATGECDLGLRYDLTVPLARVVAMHQNDLPRVFKRYQIQPVWRADRPARGRFREFYQCDIDVVGARAPLPEIDMLTAVLEVFAALGFDDISLRLNDRRVLRGMVEVAGIAKELEVEAIIALDKLDKIGLDGVRKELSERGISEASAEALLEQLDTLVHAQDALATMREVFAEHELALEGVETMHQIVEGLEASGSPSGAVMIDATLARGMDYYTGPIFEVGVADLSGSLAGGGRYDGLIGIFSKQDVPACGVSLGLERILVVMEERGMMPARATAVEVMVANFGSRTRDASLRVAAGLRAQGVRTDFYARKDKLKRQFNEANLREIPFVVVVGPDEAEQGKLNLKNMETGDQQLCTIEEAAAIVIESREA